MLYTKQSTKEKMERQLRRDLQAVENGHWNPQAGLYLVRELTESIPNGINVTKSLPSTNTGTAAEFQEGVNSVALEEKSVEEMSI